MTDQTSQNRVVVRGAGEMATGVIHCLVTAGWEVIVLEQPEPTCVRRHVCFASAVFEQTITVENIAALFANSVGEALTLARNHQVPIMIDPQAGQLPTLAPLAVIDARMRKQAVDTTLDVESILIGLGPGFVAGENCHAVIETNRGPDLGRVLYTGRPQEYTGIPGTVQGVNRQRVLRAPTDGLFSSSSEIGDSVRIGQVIGLVAGTPVAAEINGIVRGLIHNGLSVTIGQKLGDVDPRCDKVRCYRISEKARAIGRGALEALTVLRTTNRQV